MGALEYAIAAFVALLGYAGYQTIKRRSAEALNENVEVKSKLNELDKTVSRNEGLLESEEERRKQIEADKIQKEKAFQTVKDMEDFLSRDLTKKD